MSCCRPGEARSLNLVGVTLLLPQPELDYYKAYAQSGADFVVDMSGTVDASLLGESEAPRAILLLLAYANRTKA